MTNIEILDTLVDLVNKIKKDEEKARHDFAERAKNLLYMHVYGMVKTPSFFFHNIVGFRNRNFIRVAF